jgi:hypothetical protein
MRNPATAARTSAISSRLRRPSLRGAPLRPHGEIVQCPKSARELVIRNHSRTCDAGTWEQDSIPHTFSVTEVLQTIGAASFPAGSYYAECVVSSCRDLAEQYRRIVAPRISTEMRSTIHGDQSK